MIEVNGCMYMVKRMGPSTDPCGTPKCNDCSDDSVSFILTDCLLSVMYDGNHCRTVPDMPNNEVSRCRGVGRILP